MTDWTKKDTEALHALSARMFFDPPDAADCDRVDRAAAHIERLEAERAEVAKELRFHGSAGSTNAGWAVVTPQELLALATRLERRGE